MREQGSSWNLGSTSKQKCDLREYPEHTLSVELNNSSSSPSVQRTWSILVFRPVFVVIPWPSIQQTRCCGCTLMLMRWWMICLAGLGLSCQTEQERIAALPLHQTLAYHSEPMVQERLLEGLRSYDASRRLESIQTLVNLTGGEALGYVSWRSPEENSSAIAAWEQYLLTTDVVEDQP